jgi:hypothetical protein
VVRVTLPEPQVRDDDISPVDELDLGVAGVGDERVEVRPVVLGIFPLGEQQDDAAVRAEPPPVPPQAIGRTLQRGAFAIQPGDELDGKLGPAGRGLCQARPTRPG